MTEDQERAAQEIVFCEAVLAKSGDNVLSETLRETPNIEAWSHYPPGDVLDPASGAQWYYHCHIPPADETEHGHFHCFVRPDGAKGPVHHLIAIGVDPLGRLHRLFTVNQWVVGDAGLAAAPTIALAVELRCADGAPVLSREPLAHRRDPPLRARDCNADPRAGCEP